MRAGRSAGVVAAIALFLAREPLKDLATKLFEGPDGKRPARKPKKPKDKQDSTEKVE